jgi:magnesium-transporting ATPase (P-type)
MSVVCHEGEKEDQCYVMSKGSVEKLLQHCTHYQSNGKRYPLTEEIRQHLMVKNDSLRIRIIQGIGFYYEVLNIDSSLKYTQIGLALAREYLN